VSNDMVIGWFRRIIHTKQQLADWFKYLHHESCKIYKTGTSKVKLEKAMELAELGFYNKKNGFEGAYDVIDFYNKTFNNTLETTRGSSIMQMTR
jgi:hypothetical protein